MKRILLLALASIIGLPLQAVECGQLSPFEPQALDWDQNNETDLEHVRSTHRLVTTDTATVDDVAYVVRAVGKAKLLRSQGLKTDFSPGQSISVTNQVHFNSVGFSIAVLTEFYLSSGDSGQSYQCDYDNGDVTYKWNHLHEGILGVRLQTDAGFHYGWIRFTRPDLEPSTPFTMVGYDWHPVPGEPIAAGEPPSLPPLRTTLSENGLTLNWDTRFPGLILEWTESLNMPVSWLSVEGAEEGSVTLPPGEANRFYRLRRQ